MGARGEFRAIGVAVKDGILTLAGDVASFVEKWNVERAAAWQPAPRGPVWASATLSDKINFIYWNRSTT